jgi:hypothetical protein
MRKPLTSRIFFLAALYCVVFFVLVILQFSSKGTFSITAGIMTIKGRYLLAAAQTSVNDPPREKLDDDTPQEPQNTEDFTVEVNDLSAGQALTGGVKVFSGGLEFNLKENNRKGMILTGNEGIILPSNPELMILDGNTARFVLPDGTSLIFNSIDSTKGPELQISIAFAENASEASIPISSYRSTVFRDDGQTGVLYNNSRYTFSGSGKEIENGRVLFTKENTFISYRSRETQKAFDPEDYIIAQANDYENTLSQWKDLNFANWRQNAAVMQNDDDIAAYCSEAMRRGQYTAAVASISDSFINGSSHTYKSSGFTGGISAAYRSFISSEREKTDIFTRQLNEGSLEFLKEEHILDFLFIRSNTSLANNAVELLRSTEPEKIIPEYCPGLLEFYSDLKRWRPTAVNPVEPMFDQILLLISENININKEKKLVYVQAGDTNDNVFNLRLGKALVLWADDLKNNEWAAIGRSLVLSALLNSDSGSGKLYNILKPETYYSRETRLTDNGLWAWTVSPSVSAYYMESNLNISISFPQNMTHYVIIRGVRPFIKIQIHETDWRTDNQFERYDSSGWVYYQQEQVLAVKLKHRVTVENIKVIYRVVEPPPVIIEEDKTDNEYSLYM